MNSKQLKEAVGAVVAGTPQVGATDGVMPEFGRWQDVERLFGIRRGTLYNLAARGVVRSISLRQSGRARGCRLFFLPGISAYLRSLLAEQSSDPLYKEISRPTTVCKPSELISANHGNNCAVTTG